MTEAERDAATARLAEIDDLIESHDLEGTRVPDALRRERIALAQRLNPASMMTVDQLQQIEAQRSAEAEARREATLAKLDAGGTLFEMPEDMGGFILWAERLSTPYANYSQAHVAEVFARQHCNCIRFLREIGHWLVWDGQRWAMDEGDKVRDGIDHLVSGIAAAMRRDATLPPAQQRTLARSLCSSGFVNGVCALLESKSELLVRADELDADDWALNTPSGIVDLRTGMIRPHDPKAMCTKITVAPIDTTGRAERFEQFLAEVFENVPEEQRAELIEFTQQSLGYCLTGDTAIHALFFWFGEGRNGKNTLGDQVQHCLGGYARKIPNNVLMSARDDRHPTEIAQLLGVRLAVASEIKRGEYWDESRITELTGDERITARFMRQDFFEFRRTAKFLVYGNNKPRLKTVDAAIKARMKLTEFGMNFVALGRADPTLPERLRTESGAILAWLIQGAAKVWAAEKKLPPCAAVEEALEDYFTEQDALGAWIHERCERKAGHRLPPQKLYDDYSAWKKGRGESPEALPLWRATLSRQMKLGKTNGARWVEGLALKPHGAADDGEKF